MFILFENHQNARTFISRYSEAALQDNMIILQEKIIIVKGGKIGQILLYWMDTRNFVMFRI